MQQLVDLLRLSTSAEVQCTAYRILSQVIRRKTLALVLEIEASISDAEDGQLSRTIALPEELAALIGKSVFSDLDAEVEIPLVSVNLLQ